MSRKLLSLLSAALAITATGCSSIRVKVSGDPGVRYQAAWTTAAAGTTTRSGVVPASFTFDGDVLGWFQNATGNGEFRVRVYEGMGLLVDETFENSAQRVVIERNGRTVSFRID